MQKVNLSNEEGVALVEGQMHTGMFVTGVGGVGSENSTTMLRPGDGKVEDLRLINNGTLVQITLRNKQNPKVPFIVLSHAVNFKSLVAKTVAAKANETDSKA